MSWCIFCLLVVVLDKIFVSMLTIKSILKHYNITGSNPGLLLPLSSLISVHMIILLLNIVCFRKNRLVDLIESLLVSDKEFNQVSFVSSIEISIFYLLVDEGVELLESGLDLCETFGF